MKLVGLVILGLVSTFVTAILLVLLFMLIAIVTGNTNFENIGEAAGMLICFLVVIPLAFFIGGFPTGYFSYYDVENKWTLLAMVPALYFELASLCVSGLGFMLDRFIDVNPPGPYFLRGILISIAFGLYLFAASAAGVFLGYFLRERLAKWWYGD